MQPLINHRGGLLSHTLRRTRGKNRRTPRTKGVRLAAERACEGGASWDTQALSLF